jgi:hypothetical protein
MNECERERIRKGRDQVVHSEQECVRERGRSSECECMCGRDVCMQEGERELLREEKSEEKERERE